MPAKNLGLEIITKPAYCMAAAAGKQCSLCGVTKDAHGFSKKQFKAKAHERKCLVCTGLSNETGAPGLRIGDQVELHSLQAVEFNGRRGTIVAALNGPCVLLASGCFVAVCALLCLLRPEHHALRF